MKGILGVSRLLGWLLVGLFVFVAVIPTFAQLDPEPGTLIVGPGEQYETIQAAVDAASPGDTIVVRAGTYTEDVSIEMNMITLRAEMPFAVFLEGSLAIAGASVAVEGFLQVAADADAEVVGVFVAVEDGGTFELGDVRVTSRGEGDGALGAAFVFEDDALVGMGDVDVVAGNEATGVLILSDSGGTFQAGSVKVEARDDDSEALGFFLSVDNKAHLTVDNVDVVAGNGTTGIVIFSDDSGTFQIGDVTATARDDESEAYGSTLEFYGDASVTVGDVKVEAGDYVEAVNIWADDGGTFQIGDVTATARDDDSRAFGFFLSVDDKAHLTVGNVKVEAGEYAEAVNIWAGGDGTLQLADVTATARDDESQVQGLTLSVEGDVSLVLGNVKVEAGEYAEAVNIWAGGDGTLQLGDVTAIAGGNDSEASGVWLEIGDDASFAVGNIAVEAADSAEGILIFGGAGGRFRLGDVTVTARNEDFGIGLGLMVELDELDLDNAGSIRVLANDATGMLLDVQGTAHIINSGSIEAPGGRAVDGAFSGNIEFENKGLLVGDVVFGAGDDQLSVASTGRVEGDVDLSEGDDGATLHYGAALSGRLDGGSGEDKLTLAGPGVAELTGTSAATRLNFVNFEQVLVAGGLWTQTDDLATMELTLRDGVLRIEGDLIASALDLADGTLVIDGEMLVDNFDFGSGTLGGNIRIVGDLHNQGGIVAPGDFGILTIEGHYTQDVNGRLRIEIAGTDNPEPGTNHDQLNVTGDVVFAEGTTITIVLVGGMYGDRTHYTIVQGNIVNFDLDKIVVEIPGRLFLTGSLEQGSVIFVLDSVPFEAVAVGPSQKALAEALTKAKGGAQTPPATELDQLYAWLYELEENQVVDARAVYDALAGEVYAFVPTLTAGSLAGLGDAAGRHATAAGAKQERVFWAAVQYDTGRLALGNGTSEANYLRQGLVAGKDVFSTSDMQIGLAVTGGASGLGAAAPYNLLSGNSLAAGVYGQFGLGKVDLTVVAAYAQDDYTSKRNIGFGGVQRSATAKLATAGTMVSVQARFAPLGLGSLDVKSEVALTWFSTSRAAFEETGAGAVGLVLRAHTTAWWRGRLGLGTEWRPVTRRLGTITPWASVAWVGDFSSGLPPAQASLLGAGGTAFDLGQPAQASSGLELQAGMRAQVRPGFTWGADYRGEFGDALTKHALQVHVGIAF